MRFRCTDYEGENVFVCVTSDLMEMAQRQIVLIIYSVRKMTENFLALCKWKYDESCCRSSWTVYCADGATQRVMMRARGGIKRNASGGYRGEGGDW